MKKHFVTLLFKNINGKDYHFSGMVVGKMINNKLVISPEKIFENEFGFKLPKCVIQTDISWQR